jgi:hypothetical protein
MRIYLALLIVLCSTSLFSQKFNNHDVRLDDQGKILPWTSYDTFLHKRWNFIKYKVPNSPGPAPRSDYPQYFFYCAYILRNGELEPDNWMNDIGEKIPNWFESARLYYAFTGDTSVMKIVKRLADYSLDHGISPADFAWPNFPYTTTNAGDTIFRGFNSAKRFELHEIQVDHAGEIGLTYYRLYQYTGDDKYLTAAINIANTLASKVRTGSATRSPWPYRVVMSTGKIKAEYGANWFGCYELLDHLQKNNLGNAEKYRIALMKVKDFVLKYPVKTGYWTDGHTDTDVNSHTYRSNMSASNAKLFMFDRPDFNANWKADIPRMIKWTEDYFVNRGAPGEPGNQWGANIVGEQDSFLYKMDYQTARYAAECARWYAITGDESYKEKAYRSLNWVTYCINEDGLAFESPLSKNINSWWSDCYGEGPRMFYHIFAAIPEWAPANQDHILYSTGVLKNVEYKKNAIEYDAADAAGKEYLKLTFKPGSVSLNGKAIKYDLKKLDDGGIAITITRNSKGKISIKRPKVQPAEWYSGDVHVHKNCGDDSVLNENKLAQMMEHNDLNVISLLADMGNGEVKNAPVDLQKVDGKDAPQSTTDRIIHWDAEWHWDATYSNFSHQALGGHLVILGLKNAHQIWEESPYKVLEWAKNQNAARGFCHYEYLNDSIQNELNCCIPIDHPVEAALGNVDFISEDVNGYGSNNGHYNSEASINAYYKLLNCGFRLGLTAGTDYPCNGKEPLGTLLTYVNVKDGLTYDKWVDGVKRGKTVVSRNGNKEFLELKVDGNKEPGDEINVPDKKQMDIVVKWTSSVATHGTIELVSNGEVIATHTGYCTPGGTVTFKAKRTFAKSSWICARRMYKGEHITHTSPVYINVNNKPVRASAEDAMYYVKWIDNILKNIEPGAKWSRYFTKDPDSVKQHYNSAKKIYEKIADECRREMNESVLILSEKGNYIEEMLRAEGLNLFTSAPLETLSDISSFKLAILPKTDLTPSQVETLQNYVRKGGNLIAFQPSSELSPVFGLRSLNETIENGYVNINPKNDIGKGLITSVLQTHGTAQTNKLAGAKVLAFINRKVPAVTTHKFGKGRAIAFSYDLPQSVMLTRQGNYRSAGLEKDGILGLRAMDLFTDGWVDTSQNMLNQADEQMRLLSRCIRELADSPLPSLWYFPDTLKTLVTLTNDGENSNAKDINLQLADVEAKNGNMSLYILDAPKIPRSFTDAWIERGHEISGHTDNTANAEHPTWQNMNAAMAFKMQELAEVYEIPSMHTIVNHWFVWCGNNEKGEQDFTAQARIEKLYGIGMDINYAHYDNNSPQPKFLGTLGATQGNYTGSGLPMKFGNMKGKTLGIYQHLNNVYDQQYMENKDSIGFFNCFKGIMDRSLNNEVYSYISVKCHNNEYFFSKTPLAKMLDYADSNKIPVWTPAKLLDFLVTKDDTKFRDLKWTENKLEFNIQSDFENPNMLSVMVPTGFKGKKLTAITIDGKAIAYAIRKIKGISMAMFSIKPGTDYSIEVSY